jgi:sugar lactone lactonase YvrE
VTLDPRPLLDGLCFPEGPRWRAGRLWLSDMHGHEVLTVDREGRRETIVRVPTQPSGLGWLPDGRLLVVSMTDRRVLRLEGAELALHADLSEHATFHANDMVVDARGRAFVGNFGWDIFGGGTPATAKLCRVEPDGSLAVAADELLFPNGMVITPDARTLIVAETVAMRLTAFDLGADGTLSSRRTWAQLDVMPDGICLDADGCVWASCPLVPGAFVRTAEGGRVLERLDLPDHGGIACALGGPDGRDLFLCEARHTSPSQIEPGNGWIRVARAPAPHAGWP